MATAPNSLIGSTDAAWVGLVRLAEADARPGRYYVTARDSRGRTAFLLGPYTQRGYGKEAHARANGALARAKRYVFEHCSAVQTMDCVFGTAWQPLYGPAPVGKLNGLVTL